MLNVRHPHESHEGVFQYIIYIFIDLDVRAMFIIKINYTVKGFDSSK